MDAAKKQLIAQALAGIVEKARTGGPVVRVGLMAGGSELGVDEVLRGGLKAQQENPGVRVVAIGPKPAMWQSGYDCLEWLETSDCEADIAAAVTNAIKDGHVAGAVAMHYPFPIGVTTIGRVITPGRGNPMFIASCTGSASIARGESMLRNAIYGIATAKACGITSPKVAFLNIDGAGPVLRALTRMQEKGYAVTLGASLRDDGGSLLRGNDLVTGAVDVLVCDTLTGNVLVKLFSTFTTGGQYESSGWGYGPSVGENWKSVVSIISRASGAPVIAGALALTAKVATNGLPELVASELQAARNAGLDAEIATLQPKTGPVAEVVKKPPIVPVDADIAGVDVMDMESAAQALWKENIYAETAMGCTGPVVRIQAAFKEKAIGILKAAGFI